MLSYLIKNFAVRIIIVNSNKMIKINFPGNL